MHVDLIRLNVETFDICCIVSFILLTKSMYFGDDKMVCTMPLHRLQRIPQRLQLLFTAL